MTNICTPHTWAYGDLAAGEGVSRPHGLMPEGDRDYKYIFTLPMMYGRYDGSAQCLLG